MQPITVPNVVIRGSVRNNAGKLSRSAEVGGRVSSGDTAGIAPGNLLPPLGAAPDTRGSAALTSSSVPANSRHVESLLTLL